VQEEVKTAGCTSRHLLPPIGKVVVSKVAGRDDGRRDVAQVYECPMGCPEPSHVISSGLVISESSVRGIDAKTAGTAMGA
jgi:hypothetical protein